MMALPPIRKTIAAKPDKPVEIVIHVCDETKKRKKDFTCDRDLLLQEMRYFEDYFTSYTQKCDDVDISVHCDISIFEWLISFVKNQDENKKPVLEPVNVVSILISSDFLKMEKLVEKCIVFCCANLNDVIAAPCNMNCINDTLVTRIAARFDQNALEQIKDRKDKFKSKLFSQKVEDLFRADYSTILCPNNASTLFRCVYCNKTMLQDISHRITCSSNRITVDRFGSICYMHQRDLAWNLTEFLISLKTDLKTWRRVYWKLWSCINYMQCKDCDTVFPITDFNTCFYHPKALVTIHTKSGQNERVYPCCGQKQRTFESIPSADGCECKEHKIYFRASGHSLASCEPISCTEEVYRELLSVIDIVCMDSSPVPPPVTYSLDAILQTELPSKRLVKEEKREKKRPASYKQRTSRRAKSKQEKTSEEEDSDGDNQTIMCVYIHKKNDGSATERYRHRTWNNDLPLRLNQDIQRECDFKRMGELVKQMTVNNEVEQTDAWNGGLYQKIEAKLKLSTSATNITRKTKVS